MPNLNAILAFEDLGEIERIVMLIRITALAMLAAAMDASAQPPAWAAATQLVIVGRATVKDDPDVATVSFTIRGEGVTSDAALTEVERRRAAIAGGLSQLAGSAAAVTTGEVSVLEARDRSCEAEGGDDRPRLSSGACAIKGYVAEVSASVRVSPPAEAGTMLGLSSRLGASNGRVREFALRHPEGARQRAEAAALADAKERAASLARASGLRLGRLVKVEDQAAEIAHEANDIVVTATRRVSPAMVMAPPITVHLKPEPIETAAAMVVTYQLEP